METITLNISGMTCMGCVNSVTRVLKAAPGVADARVTLEPAQAVVHYDASRAQPAQLKQAVADAGFEVT
jgi:copper chaperone